MKQSYREAEGFVQVPKRYLDFKLDFAARVKKLSNKKIRALMAYLNNLIFCAAKSAGALSKGFGGLLKVTAAIARLKSLVEVTIPIIYTTSFIEKHWGGESASASSVRRMRDFFADELHLFSYDKMTLTKPGESWTKMTYKDFDVMKALVAYEQLEQEYMERCGWDGLPDHRGYVCKLIYDSMFNLSLGMNRSGDLDAGRLPPTYAEIIVMRASSGLRSLVGQRNEVATLRGHLENLRKIGRVGTELYEQIRWRIAELVEQFKPLPLEELPF